MEFISIFWGILPLSQFPLLKFGSFPFIQDQGGQSEWYSQRDRQSKFQRGPRMIPSVRTGDDRWNHRPTEQVPYRWFYDFRVSDWGLIRIHDVPIIFLC